MRRSVLVFALALLPAATLPAQESHDHGTPEHLGTVHFGASCAPAVDADIDRAVALLHSFAYDAADAAFAEVATRDPGCAIARWGRAMSRYHPLWEAPSSTTMASPFLISRTSQRVRSATPSLRSRASSGAR